jgi:hypothetical protein
MGKKDSEFKKISKTEILSLYGLMKAFKNKIKITLVWQFGASSWKNGGIICGGKEGLKGIMLFEGLTNTGGVGVHASEYIVPCVACLSSQYNLKFAILETPSQL